MTVNREELESFFSGLLNPQEFEDYGPNGLQITGKEKINRIAFAVSACRESITAAIAKNADCLVVHHGLFWKFHGPLTLTGAFGKRVIPLVKNDINLFGYHLPLDANLKVGNAKALADKIDLIKLNTFGDYKGMPTGAWGSFDQAIEVNKLHQLLEKILNHSVILACPEGMNKISTLGIITGGANSQWRLAKDLNLDGYLTGEISEHDWHESQEAGIAMFAGGHHATEKFGICALMEKTKDEFGIDCFFIPSNNPA
ncbi:MAG: Nif3-like dinuclear metal center hexameric protein [Epsilonproteobacteria bacterium]|nr:MAG: Nif3-like dinuclear metal center hexameric protein [Campylobacterota bacterium]RLA66303.1 MAG: Nif3-like dinuclear metal center hexameric protein [Campylobacterota bacterium]